MATEIKELLMFLDNDQRVDLKAVAVSYVLGLSGTEDGRSALIKSVGFMQKIILLSIDKVETIAKDAALCLINFSGDEFIAVKIVRDSPCNENGNGIIQLALKAISEPDNQLADIWAMILSNISRPAKNIETVIDEIEKSEHGSISKLVSYFCITDYNKKECHLNYLGPVFSNITQSFRGREFFCSNRSCLLLQILPFMRYNNSIVRRGGVIGVLKNICFDTARHHWLLSSQNDYLSYILYPLMGPESFDDDEMEKFPDDLQYLPEYKKREDDPDLRIMILQSLTQLCATREGRESLRSNGVYEILRELHKYEVSLNENESALNACENVVDILIRTEDEIKEDNLKDLHVPDDLVIKFSEFET